MVTRMFSSANMQRILGDLWRSTVLIAFKLLRGGFLGKKRLPFTSLPPALPALPKSLILSRARMKHIANTRIKCFQSLNENRSMKASSSFNVIQILQTQQLHFQTTAIPYQQVHTTTDTAFKPGVTGTRRLNWVLLCGENSIYRIEKFA